MGRSVTLLWSGGRRNGNKSMSKRIVGGMLVFLVTASLLDAQVHFRRPYVRYPAAVGWGFNFGSVDFASTAAEGQARGQAALIQAQGQAMQAASVSAINFEQARSQYIQNRQQWDQIRQQRRDAAEQQRAADQAARRAERERLNAQAPPRPPAAGLSNLQVDPNTGDVTWPEVLQAEKFATSRAALQDLLKVRAHTGATADINQQIFDSATLFRNELRDEIRNLPPSGYIEARRFLDQLITESRSGLG